MANPNDVQSSDGGGNSGKRSYGFRSIKKAFKSPTEGLQHIIFDYSASNNNKNVFVEKVKKLSQYIAVSGVIRHDALTGAYAVRALTAPVF